MTTESDLITLIEESKNAAKLPAGRLIELVTELGMECESMRLQLYANKDQAGALSFGPRPDNKIPVVGAKKGIELDKFQQEAIQAAVEGNSICITGGAGTGKSEVLRQLVKDLEVLGRRVRVSASTGLAAVASGGTTIHSTLGTGIRGNVNEIKPLLRTEAILKAQERFYNIDVLVIDEVSMLTGDYIAMMDVWLQQAKQNDEAPFGGLQVIFVGDFLQLPPVITKEDEVDKVYAFLSESWKTLNPNVYNFTKCYRTDNEELIEHLNRLRVGKVPPSTLKFFNRARKHHVVEPTVLYATNAKAESYNKSMLVKLPGQPITLKAEYTGFPEAIEQIKKNCIVADEIIVKPGAPVLLMKNSPGDGFVNGDRGKVRTADKERVVVELLNGSVVNVTPETWRLKDGDERDRATMTQFPLRLAWGMTIHKSQGMSLPLLECHVQQCFEKGQAYVALSRARSYEGLKLGDRLTEGAVKTSRLCRKFYEKLEG